MTPATGTKTQLVKWGNSQAVRLPKPILEQARIKEGDQLVISVEGEKIALEKASPATTLAFLVSKITPENRHDAQEWGKPVGKEVW
ncbi:MAG: AbrB/MazE/SpoVT family DNA-binding domain-containing protein [Terriglobales bacterium]